MANQPRQTRENKSVVWSANLRPRVNDSVIHESVQWVNVTGLNSEPGVGEDWELMYPEQSPAINIDSSLNSESTNALENKAITNEFTRTNDKGISISGELSTVTQLNQLNYKSVIKFTSGSSIVLDTNVSDDFNVFLKQGIDLQKKSGVIFDGDLDNSKSSIILRNDMFLKRLSGTNQFVGIYINEQKTGWQDVILTASQSIPRTTDTAIDFTGGTFSNNATNGLIQSNGSITPLSLNDLISADISFQFETPSGVVASDNFEVFIEVNGEKYRSITKPFIKSSGLIDIFSASFILPCKSDFFNNGGQFKIYSTVIIDITNKYLCVSRIHKGIG